MRPCAICGHRREAKQGSRYCGWCDGAINNHVPVRSRRRRRWSPSDPGEVVRGIARLVRDGVLIP